MECVDSTEPTFIDCTLYIENNKFISDLADLVK